MAIFDSEKRPRGLRVPSLTAMKAGTAASVSQFSFHRTKSNEAQTPEEKPAPPLPVPSSTGFPAPAPPPTKQLPPPPQGSSGPKKELPPRPRITSKVPPRRAVGSTKGRPSETSPTSATSQGQGQGIRQASSPIISSSPPNKEQPLPPTPSLGLRQAAPAPSPAPTSPQPEQEAASPATIKASNQGLRHTEPSPSTVTPTSPQLSKPLPAPVQQVQQPLPPTPPVGPQSTGSPEPTAPAPATAPTQSHQPPVQQNLPPTPPPVTLSPPPTDTAYADEETDALTPLEDFIPTPDGSSTPLDLEQMSSNEAAPPGPGPGPAHPPTLHDIVDIPAPPLNKVHHACFQEHRNMPIAQNVWCPVPCMTCHKKDQEIRHRCVFCSLRVCEGCFRSLQKIKGRGLGGFLKTLEQ